MGFAVIGKDYKLGGICYVLDQVIIPVPGNSIQVVPKSQLTRYFPNGYIIKKGFLDKHIYEQ